MRLTDRKLVRQTAAVGLVTTLLVIAAAAVGLMDGAERWLYDRRARLCQYFSPPPTDQLVHLDIDDPTLEAVGRLPWPRRKLAQMLGEVHRGGAAVVALDLVFPDPEPEVYERLHDGQYVERAPGLVEGLFRPTTGDGSLVEAVAGAGNVLLPVYSRVVVPPSPLDAAVVQELMGDLELESGELERRLRARGFGNLDPLGQQFTSLYVRGVREAAFRRVSEALEERECSLEELRARLLPRTRPEVGGSVQIRQLAAQYEKAQSLRSLRRLVLPKPPHLISVLPAQADLPPLPHLSRAAALTGSLYYTWDKDGVVRSIPLWLDQQGWLYPQAGFAMACRMLGVSNTDIDFLPDRVVLRPPDRPQISVPVHRGRVNELNGEFGLFFDIPWFGPTERWEAMYDPERRAPAQHWPLSKVWEIVQTSEKIARNNANIDRALSVVLDDDEPYKLAFDPARAGEYARQRLDPMDTAGRLAWVERTRKDLHDSGWVDAYRESKDEELTPQERGQRDELFRAEEVLRMAPAENAEHQGHLEARRADLRAAVSGKAVLIGWTATGVAADFVPTSFHSRCPGPVVHGVIFNAVMTGHFWRRAPGWVTAAATAVMGLLAIALAVTVRSPVASVLSVVLLGLAYLLVNGLVLFDYGDYIVGGVPPLVAVGAVWSMTTVTRFATEIRERRRVTARFRSYVDPQLVDYVVEHPEQVRLDGQIRELTVVFTDLAGFTALSERLREHTVEILNEYLAVMVPVIKSQKGFVNKFFGDSIMFFYGAPEANEDHAANAVATVLRMQEAMLEFNRGLQARGLPAMSMRAGICSGPMIVGDAGGEDRCDYTVLGDAVNLAARLETANKTTGTRILINARAAELSGQRFLLRPVARLQVVGKSEGVMAYEPLAFASEAPRGLRSLAEESKALVDAFQAGDFRRCLDAAERLERDHGRDGLAELYRRQSVRYLEAPPAAGFDGQIVLTEK